MTFCSKKIHSLFTNVLISICVLCVFNTVARADVALDADAKLKRSYYSVAAATRWRSERDFATPLAMMRAATMARSGASKEDIITSVTELRSEYEAHLAAGLRRDWELDKDYRSMITHGGALVGVMVEAGVQERFDATVAAQSLIGLGITGYEYFARDSNVRAASRQLGLTYQNVKSSEDQVAGFVADTFQNNPVFREVYGEQFSIEIGFEPGDEIEAINDAFPEFAANRQVSEILTVLTDGDGRAKVSLTDIERQTLRAIWEKPLNEMREMNAEALSKISQADSESISILLGMQRNAQERAAKQLEREKERVRMEGLRSGAFLAGTAIGLIDPEIGQQVDAVTSAAFEINRSIEAFQAATELGDELTGSATLIMTGNFVGVAMSLVNAFGNSGPTADEIILEQLGLIRQEIAQVRREMHERFDIVDRKLDAIYERLNEGFADMEFQLNRTTNRSLLLVRSKLEELQRTQFASALFGLDQTDLILAHLRAFELAPCLERRSTAVNVPLDDGKYVDCVVKLKEVFKPTLLAMRQAKPPQGADDRFITAIFRERQNDAMNVSFQRFSDLSERRFVASNVNGALDWVYAGTAYLDFLDDWPGQRSLIRDDNLDVLDQEGQKIADFSYAVHQDFKAHATGESETVVGKILAAMSAEGSGAVASAAAAFEAEYFAKVLKRDPLALHGTVDDLEFTFNDSVQLVHQSPNLPFCAGASHSSALPDGFERFVPEVIKQAVGLELGKIHFCLAFIYNQPIGFTNGPEPLDFPGGEGSYEITLNAFFVGEGISCPDLPSRSLDYIPFLFTTVTDTSRRAGGYRRKAPPPPLSFWLSDWKARFVPALEKGDPHTSRGKIHQKMLDCQNTILKPLVDKTFAKEQANLSSYIYGELRQDLGLAELDVLLERYYAQLSHWIWVSYSDRAPRSDLLSALIHNVAPGPLVSTTLQRSIKENKFAWDSADRFEAAFASFADTFRSEDFVEDITDYRGNFGVDELLARIQSYD